MYALCTQPTPLHPCSPQATVSDPTNPFKSYNGCGIALCLVSGGAIWARIELASSIRVLCGVMYALCTQPTPLFPCSPGPSRQPFLTPPTLSNHPMGAGEHCA